MPHEINEGNDGNQYYVIKGRNGEPLVRSTEGYRDSTDADRGLRDLYATVLTDVFGRYVAIDGDGTVTLGEFLPVPHG